MLLEKFELEKNNNFMNDEKDKLLDSLRNQGFK
jgi:hypothetical protein